MKRDKTDEFRVKELFARIGEHIPLPPEREIQRSIGRFVGQPREVPPPQKFEIHAQRARLGFRMGAAAVAVGLLVGSGLGFGAGRSVTPDGSAADLPVGLGFLPVEGWNVLQSGTAATPDAPSIAIAANTPIRAEDDRSALPGSSALPYSTLMTLSRAGIVIVASFTPRGLQPERDFLFRPRQLPLQLRDAVPDRWMTQLRLRRPLGQFTLRAAANGHNIEIHFYFGTPHPSGGLITDTQRQLDRLVVRAAAAKEDVGARAFPLKADAVSQPAANRLIDVTLNCSTETRGGIYEIEAEARAGIRKTKSTWRQTAFAIVRTGGTGSQATALDNALAWITAGKPVPPPNLGPMDPVLPQYRATLALSRTGCRSTKAQAPLSPAGLGGGQVNPLGNRLDCEVPRRVVVHVRALLRSPKLLSRDDVFRKTTIPLREGYLAVRTAAGRPLVYAEVFDTGRAKLFASSNCVRD